jgi:hypothetical protein
MHWKFESLFSIRVQHQSTLNAPPGTTSDFDLMPSASTAERMRRLNWVFKAQPDGGLILGEKVISADGSEDFVRQPAADEPFTFLLRLNNPALLLRTAPFAVKNEAATAAPSAAAAAATFRPGARAQSLRTGSVSETAPSVAVASASVPAAGDPLPAFSGRGRLLYFDNLAAVAIPQPNAPPDALPLLRLTAGDFAGLPEFASRGPTPFAYALPAGASSVEFEPLVPSGAPTVTLSPPPTSRAIRVELPDNAYRMRPLPGTQTEVIYLTGEQLDASVFGLVRIFNTAQLPVLEQNRRYTVVFAEA